MNRRGFLKALVKGGAVAAAVAKGVINPEELWEPGKKVYFDMAVKRPSATVATVWQMSEVGALPPGSRAPLAMRFVKEYDVTKDLTPCRLDVLYGSQVLRPEFAVRVVASDECPKDQMLITEKYLVDEADFKARFDQATIDQAVKGLTERIDREIFNLYARAVRHDVNAVLNVNHQWAVDKQAAARCALITDIKA